MDSPSTVYPDYYLLPIPVFFILSYIILMLRSRYLLPLFCIGLSPGVSYVLYCLCQNNMWLSIYYGAIWFILSTWFLLSRIPNQYDIKNLNDRDNVINQYQNERKTDIYTIFEKAIYYEKDWQKTIAQISISLLSACIAFMFLPDRNAYAFISTPICLLCMSAIVTLASSALLSISSFFHLSYPAQEINNLHRGLHRLNYQLSRFWHLVPFGLLLLQIVLAGHISIMILSHPGP